MIGRRHAGAACLGGVAGLGGDPCRLVLETNSALDSLTAMLSPLEEGQGEEEAAVATSAQAAAASALMACASCGPPEDTPASLAPAVAPLLKLLEEQSPAGMAVPAAVGCLALLMEDSGAATPPLSLCSDLSTPSPPPLRAVLHQPGLPTPMLSMTAMLLLKIFLL